jgi:hypothetical protein
VKFKAIPKELELLASCKSAADIAKWRNGFNVGLKGKIVHGEEPCAVFINPQDDNSAVDLPLQLAAEFKDLIDAEKAAQQ